MTDKTRRQFISLVGAGAAAVPLSALVGALPSRALAQDDLPLVDAESAQATALQYVAVSTTDGQMCSNCTLYQGAEGSEAGPCPLFPGSNVAGPGWCSAFVPKS